MVIKKNTFLVKPRARASVLESTVYRDLGEPDHEQSCITSRHDATLLSRKGGVSVYEYQY